MPRRTRHKRTLGGSWKSIWGKAKNFLKRTKLLSTVGSALSPMLPTQYRTLANGAINYAKSKGYGTKRRRRRIRRGGALRPAGARRKYGHGCSGGALSPVGGMRTIRKSGRMNPKLRGIRLPSREPAKF